MLLLQILPFFSMSTYNCVNHRAEVHKCWFAPATRHCIILLSTLLRVALLERFCATRLMAFSRWHITQLDYMVCSCTLVAIFDNFSWELWRVWLGWRSPIWQICIWIFYCSFWVSYFLEEQEIHDRCYFYYYCWNWVCLSPMCSAFMDFAFIFWACNCQGTMSRYYSTTVLWY